MVDTSGIKRASDCVAETACLVAVLALPLYFNVLTQGGYEPDKALLLRLLAIIAGAAWLTGFIARGRWNTSWNSDRLLMWLGVALLLVFALSTLLSIDQRLSLWGSYSRQQGLWTRSAYVVFLIVAATRLSSRESWHRIVSALLFGSLLATVYGILQQLGFDPVPNSGDPNTLDWPVRSTFGQHVIFASYLVLVIPFAAIRAWDHRSDLSSSGRMASLDREVQAAVLTVAACVVGFIAFLRVGINSPGLFAVYPALLISLVLVVFWLESLPGSDALRFASAWGYVFLVALLIAALLFSGARGAWLGFLASIPVFGFLLARKLDRPRVWQTILIVSVALGLLLLLLNIPNGPLQPIRTAPGLARMANITDTGGAGGSAQGRVLIWQGVGDLMTHVPAIGDTWGGPLRAVVGYGPESLHWAFETVYPLKLRVVTSEIWTWDRAHDIYLDYLVDAGILGLGIFILTMAALVWRVLTLLQRVEAWAASLLIAGGASVAGHLVDGIFGLDMSVSMLLLWIIVGMVAAVRPGMAEKAVSERIQFDTRLVGAWACAVVVAAGIMIAVSAPDHPTLAASITVLGVVVGVGVVASSLGAYSLPQIMLSRQSAAYVAVAIVCAVAIAGQTRFEAAAIQERTGLSYLASGNVPKSISFLQDASVGDIREPQYRTELAAAFATLGATHGDSAQPAYIPASGDSTSISADRASLLGQDQLFALAADALGSARAMSPLNPDVYDNLGNLYVFWNKPAQAISQYKLAARISAHNPKYLNRQGIALLEQKDPKAAAARARLALALDTTYWYSHYVLARADHEMGDRTGAKSEAALSLFLVQNYWPQPPAQQLNDLNMLKRTG